VRAFDELDRGVEGVHVDVQDGAVVVIAVTGGQASRPIDL